MINLKILVLRSLCRMANDRALIYDIKDCFQKVKRMVVCEKDKVFVKLCNF